MKRLRVHSATRRGQHRGQQGQAVVEFAIIVPVLALLLLGVIDLGRVFYTYVAVTNAAREGARFCALHPGATQAQLRARVSDANTSELNGRISATVTAWVAPSGAAASTTPTPVPSCPSDTSGDVTVSVASDFQPITPLISNVTGATLNVKESATMAIWPAPTPTT